MRKRFELSQPLRISCSSCTPSTVDATERFSLPQLNLPTGRQGSRFPGTEKQPLLGNAATFPSAGEPEDRAGHFRRVVICSIYLPSSETTQARRHRPHSTAQLPAHPSPIIPEASPVPSTGDSSNDNLAAALGLPIFFDGTILVGIHVQLQRPAATRRGHQ